MFAKNNPMRIIICICIIAVIATSLSSDTAAADDSLVDAILPESNPEELAAADDLLDLLSTENLGNPTIQTMPPLSDGGRCIERGPASCKNTTATCVKEGPACEYKKMCIAKGAECIPTTTGTCTQKGRKCHDKFSKECIKCAKTKAGCQQAHKIATDCVPGCKDTCMKDAGCEQKCAEGCLKRYQALIKTCKQQCKPCQGGTNQVCWDVCNQWKDCAETVDVCHNTNECAEEGKKCTYDKECVEWGNTCNQVQKCVEEEQQCTTAKSCVRRDTKCTHVATEACQDCRNSKNSTACTGMLKVKASCNSDCDVKCKEKGDGAQSCQESCNQGCAQSEQALETLCNKECPACQQASSACHLKCLQEETTQTCHKVCKRHQLVNDCHKSCLHEETKPHCVNTCVKWQPGKACAKACKRWNFSSERPCEQPCKQYGFEQVCDGSATKCVQWSGGPICDKLGPCLRHEAAAQAPPATNLGEPVLRDSPDAVLAGANRTQQDQDPAAPNKTLTSAVEDVPLTDGGDPIFVEGRSQEGEDITTVGRDDIFGSSFGDLNLGELSMPEELSARLVPRISPTPLSPASKMGHVLYGATKDVEQLLREGAPPTQRTPTQLQHAKQGKQKRGKNTKRQAGWRSQASAPSSRQGGITTADSTSAQAKAEEWAQAQAALKEAEKSLRDLPRDERRQFESNTAAQAVPVQTSQIETATLVEMQDFMGEDRLERTDTSQAENIKTQAGDGVSAGMMEAQAKAAAHAAAAEWRQAQHEEVEFLRAQHASF